jgi:uncharacterized membrane protein SpoIIM required for sporulation
LAKNILREALFIKKNKERWETISLTPSAGIDEMAEEFTQLVDDLGYARTFYPHSKVKDFLNAEASKRYLSIYKNRKEESNKLVVFFKYDVPLAVGRHLPVLLGCFLLFVLFFAVGFFSSAKDEHFVREMLGNAYVNKTIENIEKGNPFDVYKGGNSLLMWLGIMINNISVAFRFFLEGLAFYFFTIPDLVKEGIRLGAFEQMFFARGYGFQSVLTVMLHGTLELSGIIIAAQAGVVIGKSWMFPGTYTRMYAFKSGAKDGIKIIIGLVPVFMVAAFIEGFITRYYKMPIVFSLSILILSLVFVVGYFAVYPIRLRKQLKKSVSPYFT